MTTTRTLVTTALQLAPQLWYLRRPAFLLPRGLVPGAVAWLLAWPKAPAGSVSVQVWGLACATVIRLVAAAVAATWALRVGRASAGRPAPVAMGSGRTGS